MFNHIAFQVQFPQGTFIGYFQYFLGFFKTVVLEIQWFELCVLLYTMQGCQPTMYNTNFPDKLGLIVSYISYAIQFLISDHYFLRASDWLPHDECEYENNDAKNYKLIL